MYKLPRSCRSTLPFLSFSVLRRFSGFLLLFSSIVLLYSCYYYEIVIRPSDLTPVTPDFCAVSGFCPSIPSASDSISILDEPSDIPSTTDILIPLDSIPPELKRIE